MTFLVTAKCQTCKATDCVEVCPVDCFYEMENQLVIDPDECIDCALCEPECPIMAIYHDDELPEQYANALDFNAINAREFPNITEMKPDKFSCDA